MTATLTSRDISEGARAAAVIAREAKNDQDAGLLAYVALYACGFAGRGTDLSRYRTVAGFLRDELFVAQLYRAVPDTVEVTGWIVTGRKADQVLVAKDGLEAYIFVQELGGSPEAGDSVSFRISALRAGLMPGFVARIGLVPLVERSNLSRLYLNIKPVAAAWVLGCLARHLDVAGIPYEMKVLANPRAYLRRDAGVLYVSSDQEDQVLGIVTQALKDLPSHVIGRSAPRLTGRMAPGVNLAHEPTDLSPEGMSHGQWVAGLFRDAARSSTDARDIADRVRELIAEGGRDPKQPYLRGNQNDRTGARFEKRCRIRKALP